MVLSEYLLRLPYSIAWHIASVLGLCRELVFHCPELIDYYAIEPLLPHLPQMQFASNNADVRQFLSNMGIRCSKLPVFPRAVIMCRHATHKYPCPSIFKIGMRHGPYHFKRMTKAANYNSFDAYFFSSEADLRAAREIGVTVGYAPGFPRLDPAFNGSISKDDLDSLRSRLGFDPAKPTLLFTSTWDGSGMSAIEQWYDKLHELSGVYNLLVTTHPWTSARYTNPIRAIKAIHYIDDANTLPYIMLADVCIGDASSILAECCALDKPMISFPIPAAKRSLMEISDLLDKISIRVNSFDELKAAIPSELANPSRLAQERAEANKLMFDILDGKAGERAAKLISKILKDR